MCKTKKYKKNTHKKYIYMYRERERERERDYAYVLCKFVFYVTSHAVILRFIALFYCPVCYHDGVLFLWGKDTFLYKLLVIFNGHMALSLSPVYF